MVSGQLSTVVRQLHKLAGGTQARDVTDAELLGRFAARRDEAAFTALVKRHGPMVLTACRRVLGNHADAEDAFQATFLVLVRKAGSIKRRAALAGWLHEVALRVAMKARTRAHCRRLHEQRVPDMPRKDFLTTVVWRDLQPVLDEEVQGLPDTCREAFILCYLEGKTYDEAAQQLHCPTGTLSRRLARARELLRERLTRRGLVLPAGVLAAALSQQAAPASVPAALIASTVKTALRGAAGAVPARVAALAEGGLQAMKASKTKVALALLLAAGLLCASAAAMARSAAAEPQTKAPGPVAPPQAKAEAAKEAGQAAEKSAVSGQVLGADGKPVAGADVALYGRPKHAPRARYYRSSPKILAEVKTDRDGKFRFAADRLNRSAYWGVDLIARAPGHGLGHKGVPLEKPGADLKLSLPKERALRGRLVDLQGQPAAGATVQVAKVYGSPPFKSYAFLDCEPTPHAPRYWPEPVVTDAQGRFTLRGLPAGCEIHLIVHGGTFARQYLNVRPEAAPEKEVTLAVAPGRVLYGTVTYRDTGKPIANARLRVLSVQQQPGGGMRIYGQDARTDAGGRFRVVPYNTTSDFIPHVVAAYPPAGEPYLLCAKEVRWPRGVVLKHEVNLSLPRGVLIVGSVKEAPSGKPVADAVIQFEPRHGNNPFFARDVQPRFSDLRELVKTGADGAFSMVVLPGPGHLLINAPTPDYVHAQILARDLYGTDIRPNRRYYPDGLVALDLKPKTDTHRVEVTLKRATTLRGRVLGPDGKAVPSGYLLCRCYVASGFDLNGPSAVRVKDGRFELPGWDPDHPAPLYFLSPELGLGGVLKLKGGQETGEVTVRLQKVGGAKVRVKDRRGKPLADAPITITMPLSPGASFFEGDGFRKEPTADEAMLNNFDHENLGRLRTDADGRVELRGLVPGARHWVVVTRPNGGMVRLPVDLDAVPGKTLDLKEVTVPMME
jgi:RNA polymerase sigma factor (sigma-70 family)